MHNDKIIDRINIGESYKSNGTIVVPKKVRDLIGLKIGDILLIKKDTEGKILFEKGWKKWKTWLKLLKYS